jgi:hypothetical protein
MTLDEAEQASEIKRSTINRLELAESRPRPVYVKTLLAAYGVQSAEADALLQLTRDVDTRGWWSAHADALTRPYLDYVMNESRASEIHTYEAAVIPGLMQTRDYANTVIRANPQPLSDDVANSRAEVRMGRTPRLTGPDPLHRFVAFIDETTIRRPTGGPTVMREQLRYLVELARRPNVTLQLIPREIGVHVGMVLGSFSILRFPNHPTEPDAMYVDSPAGEIWAEDEALRTATLALDAFRTAGLDVDASVERIHAAMEALPND